MLTKLSDANSGQTDDQATGNLFLLFSDRALEFVARYGTNIRKQQQQFGCAHVP
jgi:hypothetical protein